MEQIKNINIQGVDVVLIDYSLGCGKLIISHNDRNYNFSYQWGSMGSDLKTFLLNINSSYFVGKLGTIENGSIDIKKTMANVRQWWKHESGIAWYQNMDEQKDLRRALNFIENSCYDESDFINRMSTIDNEFYFKPSMFKSDFQDAIEALSCEPWHHIVNKEHPANIWLEKFFIKLQTHLKIAS